MSSLSDVDKLYGPGYTGDVTETIRLQPGEGPVYTPQYRVSPREFEEIGDGKSRKVLNQDTSNLVPLHLDLQSCLW